MSLVFTSPFCKSAACPSSQALLASRGGLMNSDEFVCIEQHLATCDFCGAELQLLTCCRVEAEEYVFAEMPVPLRRLAEDLLLRPTPPFKAFIEYTDNRQVSH